MNRVDIVPASVVTQAMRGEHSITVEPVGVEERWQLEGLVAADIMRVCIAQERHALCNPPQPPGLPDLKICVQHDHQPCAIPPSPAHACRGAVSPQRHVHCRTTLGATQTPPLGHQASVS